MKTAKDNGLRSAIDRYLETISDSDRKVLYQRYAERKTVTEIARFLKIEPTRVEQILASARSVAFSSSAESDRDAHP